MVQGNNLSNGFWQKSGNFRGGCRGTGVLHVSVPHFTMLPFVVIMQTFLKNLLAFRTSGV